MINRLIKLLLLPAALWCLATTSFAEDGRIPVWNPVPKVKGSQHFFVGFQEAKFIRARIGEWLPKGLLNISENDDLYFTIQNVIRKDLTVVIQILVDNKSTQKKAAISWQWTLPTDIGDVEVVVAKLGVIEVRYPKTGEIREIRLMSVRDISAAKEHFKISRAAPLWKWRSMPWSKGLKK